MDALFVGLTVLLLALTYGLLRLCAHLLEGKG
jgi:hypothetical protein